MVSAHVKAQEPQNLRGIGPKLCLLVFVLTTQHSPRCDDVLQADNGMFMYLEHCCMCLSMLSFSCANAGVVTS